VPQGTLKVVNGLYVRRFGKALVLLAPHSGSGGTYLLPQAMYTPEGKRLSGTIIINPGKGFLLLDEPVVAPDLGMLDFYEQEPMLNFWPRAEIRVETNGNRYLHLQKSPKRREWEHDLMLDPVRTLSPASTLRMKVRSTESNTKIVLVAEVDDLERKHFRVALEVVSISEGAPSPSIGPSISFRSPETRPPIPHAASYNTLRTDGQWQELSIGGNELFGKTKRYTFRRWSFVRFIGTMDVDSLRLTRVSSK
jgi:hypothetical protein